MDIPRWCYRLSMRVRSLLRGAAETRTGPAAPDGGDGLDFLTPSDSPAANFAFDVTPARLVTALITERGVCAASEAGLLSLYPEQAKAA